MGQVRAIIAALLLAGPVLAMQTPPEFERNWRAQAGAVSRLGSSTCITGGTFRMTGPDTFGPTNHFASIQTWTERAGETLTLAFGARAHDNYLGIVLMACPNADASATNPAVNRFEILDISAAGVYSGYPTTVWNYDSALMMDTNGWHHYAFSYTPRTGLWIWYKDGLRQGSTNVSYAPSNGVWAGVWTNGWKTDAVMVLQTMTVPMGTAYGRPEFDGICSSENALTDIQIFREFLRWNIRKRGVTVDDPFSLAVTVSGIPRSVPNSQTTHTNYDAVIYSNSWNVTRFDQRVSVSLARGLATWGMSVDGGYYMDPCGVVSNTANGAATVTITATNSGGYGFTNRTLVAVSLTNQAETMRVYRTGVAGSLRKSCADYINARVGGGQRSMWTTWNPAATNYARSTNCWIQGIEAASVWNSRYNSGGVSPTLVAPDLVIGCAHSHPGAGDVIRWVTAGNVVVTSTVIAAVNLANYPAWPDVSLMRISPAVTNIAPAPILPTNAATRLAYQYGYLGAGVPAVKISQTGRVDTLDVYQVGDVASYVSSTDTNRAAYYAGLIGGDSGNPCFWFINGTATVANVWTTYTSGAFLGAIPDSVFTAAAIAVGSTNRVTRIHLGAFNAY